MLTGKDDDIVKLYDLTGLYEEYSSENLGSSDPAECSSGRNAEEQSAPSSPRFSENGESGAKIDTGDDTPSNSKNPFRTAVSLLLYKVARNILQNAENRGTEEASAKRLLTNCLQLLDKEKYPQIATSAHFMLSDLYVPDDIDPANPKAKFKQDISMDTRRQAFQHSVSPNRHYNRRSSEYSNKTSALTVTPSFDLKTLTNASPKQRSGQKKQGGGGSRRQSKQFPHQQTENEAPNDTLLDEDIEDDLNFISPPLTSCVVERCRSALSHVAEGLVSLKKLSKRHEQEEKKELKARELYERDNPKMSRPTEAIPMPYTNNTSTVATRSNRSRCQSESAITASLQNRGKVGRPTGLSWHDHLQTVLLKKVRHVYNWDIFVG